MSIYKCNVCQTFVEPKDPIYDFFKNDNGTISSTHTFVCQNCFCSCCPRITPWSWIKKCLKCNQNTICKTCKHYSYKFDFVCLDCSIIEAQDDDSI